LKEKIRDVLRTTAALALLLVAGCGSSGSGGSQATVELASGQILDSLIQGLDYRSTSRSGLTDAQGTFFHGAGETVTFSIGNLSIGSTNGKPIATIIDLVDGATLVDRYDTVEYGTSVNSQRVKNIARLLQSLDSDCNAINGIQITSQIRAEVSPRVIDFDQSSNAFGSDPVISDIFNRLNSAGAFSGGCVGALKPETAAVEHLAKSARDTWRVASSTLDSDGDGTIDATNNFVRDARGRIIEMSDYDYDMTIHWSYDDTNNTALIRRDDGRNGNIDYILRLTYDQNRNVVKEEHDSNADGVVDEVDTYERDQFGRETTHWWEHTNGQKYRYRTTYDGGNKVLLQIDSGDTHDFVEQEEWIYAAGKLVEYIRTSLSTVDRYFYTYAGGNLVREDYDHEDDGIFDRFTEYTYDANGNKLTTKAYDYREVGGVFSWVLDFEETFVFNQNNQYVEQVIVFHYSDGSPDETHRQVVVRDANGNITRAEWHKPTGAVQIQTFTWEPQSIPSGFDIYISPIGPLAFA
jgi:hypothetical protein